jgi:hypothetical protein
MAMVDRVLSLCGLVEGSQHVSMLLIVTVPVHIARPSKCYIVLAQHVVLLMCMHVAACATPLHYDSLLLQVARHARTCNHLNQSATDFKPDAWCLRHV